MNMGSEVPDNWVAVRELNLSYHYMDTGIMAT